MRYIAIDPGETTGLAFWWDDDEVLRPIPEPAGWQFDQIGPNPHHARLYGILFEFKPDVVICERFNYESGRDNVILTSVEYIGVAKLYVQAMQKGCILEMQPRRIGNALFPQEKCERLGLWQPGKPHANDAMQHMLYFLTTKANDHRWIHQLRPPS